MIVERHRGSAAELHALEVPSDDQRRLWILDATDRAVVLGSSQRDDVVDRAAASTLGIDVVRRRSGGGAVWVAPNDPIWVDVLVPRDDPIWTDDVSRAFLPIGDAWVAALDQVGVRDLHVHDGPMLRTRWSDLVCFAGTGPGEVRSATGKVVGISQRRTRHVARFQCAVPRSWEPEALVAVLRDPPPIEAIASIGDGIGDVDVDALLAAFVAALA